MKYEIVEIKEKTLVGLKARIKEEKTAHDTIWNLWKDLYSEKGVKNVKDRKNGNLMGVYYNYSNENGFAYDCLTGCEVKDTIDKIPEKMIKIQIPEGKYAKFVITGNPEKAVGEFWNKFWKELNYIIFSIFFFYNTYRIIYNDVIYFSNNINFFFFYEYFF